jgi:hypothetical protein
MAVTLTTAIGGTPDDKDRRAAMYAIDLENERRALQDPPLDPLPYGDNAELATSYRAVLDPVLNQLHEQYLQASDTTTLEEQVKEVWKNATDAQRAAMIAAGTA